MKRISITLIVGMLLCIAFISNAYSQGEGMSSGDYSYFDYSFNTIDQIKAEISALLAEHGKLDQEYEVLSKQAYGLQETIKEQKGKLIKIKKDKYLFQKEHKDKKYNIKAVYNDISSLETEVMIRQSKNTYLSGNLIDIDGQLRVLKLKIDELQYQKRELQMNVKLKQVHIEEKESKQNKTLKTIENEHIKSLEKEKALNAELAELQQQYYALPDKIAIVQDEITGIEREIDDLNKQKLFRIKENQHIQRKKELKDKMIDVMLSDKKKKKDNLQVKVDKLQEEYDIFDQKIKKFIASKERRHEVMKSLINIDRENISLRLKIDKLKEKIVELGD